MLYSNNEQNDLFQIIYLFDFGKNEDPAIGLALDYLDYLGTEDKSASELKKEFYKIGCDYSVFANNERVYITLSGLQDNMTAGMQLLETILQTPVADEEALANARFQAALTE